MTLAPMPAKRRARRVATANPKRMTEAAFVRWALSEAHVRDRVEWVKGEVIYMSPVSVEHGDAGAWLISVLRIYAEQNDLGRVLGPEVMVRFASVPSRRLPDVFFVAKDRLGLFKQNHLEGAPDLIIEVVSPDSESRDWREKFAEYEKNGVREYWIIDPNSLQVEAYALKRKKYRRIDEVDGIIRSAIVRGFWVKTGWLWSTSRPNILSAVRALGVKG
ncbi:MAG: hypothetical protein QOF78_2867 [Phycisphaerales bacterium]|nr:hypothetical protein [Phycisphaerales bacterium]